jgi:hypothetical protein
VIRDGNGTRALDTLLRYRGSALAELWRALRLLKALQAEAAHEAEPIEPETRSNPGLAAPAPAAEPAPEERGTAAAAAGGQCPRLAPAPARSTTPAAAPIRPEARA